MADYLSNDLVSLRGMLRSDLELYRGWINNPDVTHYMEMGWRPYTDYDLEKTFIEATQSHTDVVMVVEDRATGKAVGTTGLYLINWPGRRAQFRIMLGDPGCFGKGIGTAATRLIVKHGFERMNMECIYLGANEENAGAIRAYEKAGFVHNGVQPNFIYNNGRYYNAVMMSIIRADYFAARAADA